MIAIFIPTMYRSERIAPLVANIHATTDVPHTIYCMTNDPATVAILQELGETYWEDSGDTRYVTRINTMYQRTSEPYIFTGADDILFHPGWTKAIGRAPVVGVGDMYSKGEDATNFIIERTYVQQFSGCTDTPDVIFYPGYQHNWCDNELMSVARKRGVYAKHEQAIVEHLHWRKGKADIDAVYELGNSMYDQDKALYEARCAAGRAWKTLGKSERRQFAPEGECCFVEPTAGILQKYCGKYLVGHPQAHTLTAPSQSDAQYMSTLTEGVQQLGCTSIVAPLGAAPQHATVNNTCLALAATNGYKLYLYIDKPHTHIYPSEVNKRLRSLEAKGVVLEEYAALPGANGLTEQYWSVI